MTEHLSVAFPPRQARSEASTRRIVDAARDILLEQGWDGFTVAAVSARAGVSVGLIYQRFGDKDGLFTTLHNAHLELVERACEQMCELLEPRVSATPAREAAVTVITEFGRFFRQYGAMNGVMMLNSVKVDGLAQAGASAMTRIRNRVIDVLRPVQARAVDDRRDGDADIRLAVAYRMAFASFLDYATYGIYDDGPTAVSWTQLIDEVAAAVAAYLTG